MCAVRQPQGGVAVEGLGERSCYQVLAGPDAQLALKILNRNRTRQGKHVYMDQLSSSQV